jgi:hypothetical protein
MRQQQWREPYSSAKLESLQRRDSIVSKRQRAMDMDLRRHQHRNYCKLHGQPADPDQRGLRQQQWSGPYGSAKHEPLHRRNSISSKRQRTMDLVLRRGQHRNYCQLFGQPGDQRRMRQQQWREPCGSTNNKPLQHRDSIGSKRQRAMDLVLRRGQHRNYCRLFGQRADQRGMRQQQWRRPDRSAKRESLQRRNSIGSKRQRTMDLVLHWR